jgi:hypothetical protein
MILALAKLVGFKTALPAYLILVAFAFVSLTGASSLHVYNRSTEREAQVKAARDGERALWQLEAEKEKIRQRGINQIALAAALQDVARLQGEKIQMEIDLAKMEREANDDPTAGRPALSPDGVLRLNRIR